MQNNKSTIIIESDRIQSQYFKDLLRYRELLYFFAWRDILVRYRQAFFGVAWAIVRPVLTMLIFALIFGRIADLDSKGVNYGLFVLAGMIPWQLFANCITDTCNSLVNNAHLITKIYFPRMIIPTSYLIVHMVDLVINLVFLAILMIFTQPTTFFPLLLLPVFVAMLIFLCLGVSLWLSALTVEYRDFRIIVPFILQFGMFLSPVGYGTFIIPEKFQWLYFFNPLVGIIDGFRWCIFNITYPLMPFSIAISFAMTTVTLLTGFFYFRRTEKTFADHI